METRATCLYVLVPALALDRAADKSKIRVVVSKAGWDWEVASPFELHRNGVIIAQASGPAICFPPYGGTNRTRRRLFDIGQAVLCWSCQGQQWWLPPALLR